jgi:hypothetical protein
MPHVLLLHDHMEYPGGLLSAFLVAHLLWLSRKLHGDLHDMLPFLRYSFIFMAHYSLTSQNCLQRCLFFVFLLYIFVSFVGEVGVVCGFGD